jgi:hypothetical protein
MAQAYHTVVTSLSTSRKRRWGSQRWEIRQAWQTVISVPCELTIPTRVSEQHPFGEEETPCLLV